jgi:hypothetical protein
MHRKQFAAFLRVLAVVGLLFVAGGPAQTPAEAQSDPNNRDIPASATIGGSGAGATMYIECAWEVVDTTPTTAQFDYNVTVADDDNVSRDQTLLDGVTTAGAPCAPTTATNMVNFKRHSIQLRPNADDNPIERQYQKWVAVESTAIGQIGDVFWKVWEPYVGTPPYNNSPSPGPFGPNCVSPETFPGDPGTLATAQYCLKYQHHATANRGPVGTGNPLITQTCASLQGPAATAMFSQAINTGQMTAAERDAIITRCFQNEKSIFNVTETVSKEQPCGEYRVEVTVVNTSGNTTKSVNFFDVECFIYLQTDFTSISWGTIQNNVASNLSGNMVFNPGDGAPTVRNVGNAPLYIEAGFDPLIFGGDPTKNINQFDIKLRAEWRSNPAELTIVDPIFARDPQNRALWACFGDQPIGSNQNGKLDLSIHPVNAQAGLYSGNFNIVARTECTTPPRLPSTFPTNPNSTNTYFYNGGGPGA